MLKILAFDLSSGESGVDTAVRAATTFLNNNKDWKIKGFTATNIESKHDRLEIIKVADVVGANDTALEVRRNTETTLVRSIKSTIDGEVDGVVSAASSGPLVAAAYLMSRAMEGLKPAFAAGLKGTNGKLRIMLDMGANLNVSPEALNQYAVMGSEYAKAIGLSTNPNVHLLNIGTEPKKGLSLQQETYKLLQEDKRINFKGNIESNNVFSQDDVEVLVTDAFSGNIVLKAYEGAFFTIRDTIKGAVKKSILDKIGFLLAVNFRKAMKIGSNANASGAIVLGINHFIFKVHGRAEEDWLYNSLEQTKILIEKDLVSNIRNNI